MILQRLNRRIAIDLDGDQACLIREQIDRGELQSQRVRAGAGERTHRRGHVGWRQRTSPQRTIGGAVEHDLERALEDLDRRQGIADDGHTDLLVVVESGLAPARQSRGFNLPIISGNNLVVVPVSFPVLRPEEAALLPDSIEIDGAGALSVIPITSIDAMARRALQDDMPGIMLRGIIRSTVKGAMQREVRRQDSGGLAELAVTLGALLTESADERGWRTLPARIAIARGRVPAGAQRLRIPTARGAETLVVSLAGRHAVISVRLLGGRVFAVPVQRDTRRAGKAGSTPPIMHALW